MVYKYSEVIINDIDVMCLSGIGLRESADLFIKLENKIGSLKGRKFYGCLNGSSENGVYCACVERKSGEIIGGLESWKIPGGKYARAKIEDWEDKIDSIAKTFIDMSFKYQIDLNRPHIEFYRSQKKLILLLPIK